MMHDMMGGGMMWGMGGGRGLGAIKRMIPAHVLELSRIGWNAKTEDRRTASSSGALDVH